MVDHPWHHGSVALFLFGALLQADMKERQGKEEGGGISGKLPGLVVLDLDFTLWDCGGRWVDCVSPPFFSDAEGSVRDQTGAEMRLYDEVTEILDFFQQLEIPLAVASRTTDPPLARQLMGLLGIAGRFEYEEIYPGSKVQHFRAIRGRFSGSSYREMLFFDDEDRNIKEVSGLGVESHLVAAGLGWPVVRRALKKFEVRVE